MRTCRLCMRMTWDRSLCSNASISRSTLSHWWSEESSLQQACHSCSSHVKSNPILESQSQIHSQKRHMLSPPTPSHTAFLIVNLTVTRTSGAALIGASLTYPFLYPISGASAINSARPAPSTTRPLCASVTPISREMGRSAT